MNNSLNTLLEQEQKKLAVNVFRLASYYTPFSRIPDQLDFESMEKRLPTILEDNSQIKQLWPAAQDKFVKTIQDTLVYAETQQTQVQALIDAGAESSLSSKDLFEHALSKDFHASRLTHFPAAA